MWNHRKTHTCATVTDNRIYIASDSSKIQRAAIKKVCRHTIVNHSYTRCLKHALHPIFKNMDFTKPNSLDTSQCVSQTNNTKTFAETTVNIQFPKKDQAIVFNSIKDVPQIEYIKAFSQFTSPTNITFASRISNNRFCIYFANKYIIISQQSHIVINNSKIILHHLFNPAKRIILSNVQPIIPHDVIKNAISNLSTVLQTKL